IHLGGSAAAQAARRKVRNVVAHPSKRTSIMTAVLSRWPANPRHSHVPNPPSSRRVVLSQAGLGPPEDTSAVTSRREIHLRRTNEGTAMAGPPGRSAAPMQRTDHLPGAPATSLAFARLGTAWA